MLLGIKFAINSHIMKLLLNILFLFWVNIGVWATAPISYSGKVSIYNSNYHGYAKFTFSLYDSNHTVVWKNGTDAEDSTRVFVSNGRYRVLLGGQGMNQIDPQLFLQNAELYLKVEFDNEDGFGKRHLKPDQRITASAYSLSAEYARIALSVVSDSVTKEMLNNELRNDLNRTITHSMLSNQVQSDLNRTITRAMLSSQVQSDLNKTITHSMLSNQVQSDLNRTITRAMLSSQVQSDLNKTITHSMLSNQVQSDLNRTITRAMLSSQVQSDLNRTVTRAMLSSQVQSDLNRTITRAMLSSQVQSDLNATIVADNLSSNIKRHFMPSITTQPQNTTINSDSNGSLTVVSSGKFLSYQWKKNGSSLAGETNASLSIIDGNATLHEGNYTVVVTNDFGNQESNQAEILIANPPVEILAFSGGTNSGNLINAWQRILVPAPYTSHSISSIDLYLRSSGTVYLEVFSQSASASSNPNTRFAGLSPVVTSNSKTFNHGSYTAVNFDFPDGTNLNANPPYYIWAKSSSGSPQIQWSYVGGGTTGGVGNNPGNLNTKVYGIAP